jgi:hypothetical protein
VRGVLIAAPAALALALAPSALAVDNWLPHSSDATWTYQWTDSAYATTPTTEKVTVKSSKGNSFVLAWTTDGLENPDDAVSTAGTVSFQESNSGIVNTDWSSTPPPSGWPVLCASASQCGNALSSVYYNVIWGSRNPVLEEPLVQGLTWSSTGGAGNDVASTSTYLGQAPVTVPAFKDPVMAARVRTTISQAGALGDPYGSGQRTVWWVYGVGPVKMEFQHAGGSDAPITTSELQTTSLTPKMPPTDVNYFPLTKGLKLRYRWTNTKWIKQPSIQTATIDEVVNNSARFTFQHVSGPIKVAGSYGFSTRTDGVTNIWGLTKAATAIRFPALGPKALPADKRRHFFTPFDLMNFGFNPVLPAYPAAGQKWGSKNPSRDFSTFGVNGSATIVGVQKVKVPGGTFDALVVRSSLSQPGFKFGSGTRTTWFAPDKGLVKLVFRHGDGSVSTVVLLK